MKQSSILDQLESTEIKVSQLASEGSESNSRYLEPAVVRPDIYTYAWIFRSVEEDRVVLPKLEQLDARLHCIMPGEYEYMLNYLKFSEIHFDRTFTEMPKLYQTRTLLENDNYHGQWLLQFRISQKMTLRTTFRLFLSIGDWIHEIHNMGTLESFLYESDGRYYRKILKTDADYFYGSKIIKRGKKQVQPGQVDLIDKLLEMSTESNTIPYDRDRYKIYCKIYDHYAETRKDIPLISFEILEKCTNDLRNTFKTVNEIRYAAANNLISGFTDLSDALIVRQIVSR